MGRVITDKDYKPLDLLIDDQEFLKKALSKVEEGSFHLEM